MDGAPPIEPSTFDLSRCRYRIETVWGRGYVLRDPEELANAALTA
jgi:hypothetical protein